MRFEVNTFREKFSSLGWKSVEVGSVHQFQGKEKLVVIISTVRSSSKSNPSMKNSLGFLTNPKVYNVCYPIVNIFRNSNISSVHQLNHVLYLLTFLVPD
ncbi:probable RNA helicase SDE3 [Homalodisca vitripennis]|uniref:probable RNA helicase SDE3 n=1 Tax=Homalodisca vitripennis TaxID=197043 RepID=UPI001EEC20D9|nr:probable RNA helicase SDE3 [Homalodisca vitripennis]